VRAAFTDKYATVVVDVDAGHERYRGGPVTHSQIFFRGAEAYAAEGYGMWRRLSGFSPCMTTALLRAMSMAADPKSSSPCR
jgi:hypothetical protein